MFQKQHALMVKYQDIERKNGFYYPPIDPFPHIDDAQFQNRLKGEFWRVTEELAEAMECCPLRLDQWRERYDTEPDLRHFLEEIADALHFFIEVSIMLGARPETITQLWRTGERVWKQAVEENYFGPVTSSKVLNRIASYIIALGLIGNCLRNKPWKSSQMPADVTSVQLRLTEAWVKFLNIFLDLGMSDEEVYRLYHKKNMVNQFRQNTKY